MSKRRSPRRSTPPAPPVVVDVMDGDGMIEMVGDDVASMLLLAGAPVLLQGDTANYAWQFGRAGTQGSAEVKSLVEWETPAELDALVRPGHADPSIPALLRPLLRLLRSGRYLMTVLAPQDVHRVGFAGPGEYVWLFDPYEGAAEEIALVATDAWPPLDRARVAHYRDLIAHGRRPAVVALFPPGGLAGSATDSFVGYLLDGHHKLAAYGTRAAPPVIALTPIRPFPPGNEQVRQAVPAFVDVTSEHHRHGVIGLLDHLRTLSLGVTSEADELARTGRSAAAVVRYRGYLAHQRQFLAREAPDGHAVARVRLAMAENRHKLGRTLLRQGQRDEGTAELRAALADYVGLLGERHPATVDLAGELDRLASGSTAPS